MANRSVILVSGPDLAPPAVDLGTRSGYEIVFTPAYADEATLVKLMKQHDPVGVVSRAGKFGAAPIASGQALRIVSKHGAGVDNIDVDAATKHGVQVIRATGSNAQSVAEHAVALTLAVTKQLRPLDKSLRGGKWNKMGVKGRELSGMRVGVIGAGAIAQAAGRLFLGLGLHVSAYDPYAPDAAFVAMGATRFTDLDQLLQQADIISLHCPLTTENHHIVDARRLALMPQGSYVVNTARGGLVDETALLAALESGQIAGAGLDVLETEPPQGEQALFAAENLIVTPHIGASTAAAMERVAVAAVQGIIDYLDGRDVAANRLVNTPKFKRPGTGGTEALS